MALKAITIDFWNTLFDSSNGQQRNNFRMSSLIKEIDKFGLSVKQDEFSTAMQASWGYFNDIWLNGQRTPQPEETVEFFWKQLNLPYNKSSIDKIVKDFGESIMAFPPSLMSGAKDTLKQLSEKYKLGIVSDTGFTPGTILRELMKKNGVFDFFSAFSFSDETGVAKPQPKAYLTILEKFDVQPEEALHIGDIEQTDIAGAKSLGMKAIRFNGDSTYFLTPANPENSAADALAYSWEEIIVQLEIMNFN